MCIACRIHKILTRVRMVFLWGQWGQHIYFLKKYKYLGKNGLKILSPQRPHYVPTPSPLLPFSPLFQAAMGMHARAE